MISGDFDIELEGAATLSVESPSGMVLNFMKNTFPSAALYNRALDGDETIDEYAMFDVLEPGAYTVSVSPRTAAAGGNLFSLSYNVNGDRFTLVNAQPLVADSYNFIVAPAGQSPINPRSGQVVHAGTVTLSWPDAGSVSLQIAHDPAFSDMVLNTDVTSNTYDFLASAPGDNDTSTYYWRLLPSGQTSLSGEMGKIGVFHVSGVITDVDDGSAPLPLSFRLGQNYPNPFNPATTIQFTTAERSFVTLEITNIVGQKVRTLLAQPMTAGSHQVTWLGRNDAGQEVSSGIYFYRLSTGKHTAVKKMILLK